MVSEHKAKVAGREEEFFVLLHSSATFERSEVSLASARVPEFFDGHIFQQEHVLSLVLCLYLVQKRSFT